MISNLINVVFCLFGYSQISTDLCTYNARFLTFRSRRLLASRTTDNQHEVDPNNKKKGVTEDGSCFYAALFSVPVCLLLRSLASAKARVKTEFL